MQLKDATLFVFIKFVKAQTSWGDVKNLERSFEESGFTGIFTGFDEFFSKDDFLDEIRKNWNCEERFKRWDKLAEEIGENRRVLQEIYWSEWFSINSDQFFKDIYEGILTWNPVTKKFDCNESQ